MLTELQSVARVATRVTLDIYDKEQTQTLLPLIARVRKHDGSGKKGTLEWWTAFPELRQWVGDRVTQEAFQGKLQYELAPYEVTFDYDRLNVELGNPLAADAIQEMSEAIARGVLTGKVQRAYRVITSNPVTYDGQDMFDTAHVHPNGKEYSNLLALGVDTPARADAARPTPSEVRAELRAGRRRLLQNSIVRNQLVRNREVKDSLVVITRSDAVSDAFDDLLNEERIEGQPNRFKGSFNLLQDLSPPPGTETSYDIVHSLPNGPRPVLFVSAKEPKGVTFDTSSDFRNRHIPFGTDAIYGFAPAFPQTVVRITE